LEFALAADALFLRLFSKKFSTPEQINYILGGESTGDRLLK